MPFFKLTPTNLADPAWTASRHRGPALVRAASEGAARRVTAAAFRNGEGAEPWTNPALVKAEEVEDPRYDARGRSEVLDPAA